MEGFGQLKNPMTSLGIKPACSIMHQPTTLLYAPKLLFGYKPKNIFNAVEIWLAFRHPPHRTLHLKGDHCNGGKNSNERTIFLLACGADGTDRLPQLITGKSENPQCFKKFRKLLTKYVANRKAWVTQASFTDSLRALDAKMSSKNRKILLLIDWCAVLSQDTSYLKNVKVVFLQTSQQSPQNNQVIPSSLPVQCRIMELFHT
jgi:hypothetical protein